MKSLVLVSSCLSAVRMRSVLSVMASLSILLLAGCGGGSGSSDSRQTAPAPSEVSGVVTDPAIEGAAVRLLDSEGDVLSRIVRTGTDGTFKFELSDTQLASLSEIVAVGGRDIETGANLTGITFRARAAENGYFVVSPVTTLFAEAGDTLTGDQLSALLGLGSADELLADPADNEAIQALSLELTDIVLAMRDEGLGWKDLVNEVQLTGGDLAATAENLAKDADSPLMAVADRLRAMEAASVEEGVNVVERWNLLRIEEGLASFYRDSLGVTVEGDAADAVSRIAKSVWEGAGRKGVEPDSPGILNLARYLVTVYGLDDASLTGDLVVPPELESDELVAFVISTDFVDHRLPLAEGELLTNDNAERAEYFLSSDLSPFYRAEQLFEGVSDDAITDPVYAEIAAGLASSGLIERAERTVRSKIFQPGERADAFRRVGAILTVSGFQERGVSLLDIAAEIYTGVGGIIESVGARNLTTSDAEFLQDLTSDYLLAGQINKASNALEPVRALREALSEGAYFTYQPIASALKQQAEVALGVAIESGLQGGDLQRAEVFTDTAAEWVDSYPEFPVPVAGMCRLQQTLETAGYADLYSRLGDREKTLAALDTFESLIQLECNETAAGYIEVAAMAYTRIGELERLQSFLKGVVVPIQLRLTGVTSEATVQPVIAVAAGQRAAQGGGSALEAYNAQFDGLEAQELELGIASKVYHMVGGIKALGYDANPLYGRLLADGYQDDAQEIVDAAWNLVDSTAFAEAAESPKKLVEEGCRAAALATADIGDQALALERLDACANLAANQYGATAATQDRIDALTLVAEGYLDLGQYPGVQINAAKGQIAVLGDLGKRLKEYRDLAALQAKGGRLAEALETLDSQAITTLNGLAPATDVDSATTLVKQIVDVAQEYARAIESTRGRLATDGKWQTANADLIAQARDRIRELVEGGAESSLAFEGALSVLELVDEGGRVDLLYQEFQPTEGLVGILNSARHYDFAKTLAREDVNPTPDVNKMLNAIATALAMRDDYPGTSVARFDFDGDGLADFFDPQSTEAEQMNAPFDMDDDIDNDGIQDATDSTPYCAACG